MLKCFADLKHVIVEVPGTTESAHPFLLNLHVSLFPREVINLQPLRIVWLKLIESSASLVTFFSEIFTFFEQKKLCNFLNQAILSF